MKRSNSTSDTTVMSAVTGGSKTFGGSVMSYKGMLKLGTPSSNTSRAVWTGRLVFVLTLIAVAITFGSVSYKMLTRSEHQLTEEQFASIADRATCSAKENMERKRLGTKSLASVIGGANPNADQWPMVTVNNFENIAWDLIITSHGCNMGFAPIVRPDQLQDFEEFMYNYYYHTRQPKPWPNGTLAFEEGVWSKDPETGKPYHDVNGTTSWGSPYNYLAPLVHHNTGNSKKLLMNGHSSKLKGAMMDSLMHCAEEKAAMGGSLDECVIVSDVIANKTPRVPRIGLNPGPGASMVSPVYAANEPTKVVGVVTTGIVWSELFLSTYAEGVSGIDIVLKVSPSNQFFTYGVHEGEIYLKGEGDLHDTQFDQFVRQLNMTDPELFGTTTSHYSLELYPTQELYDVYTTPNPMIAGIGAVCIIAFTSILFWLYDLSVRKEFNAKKDLLEAKRQFCRFVSHEVRTPLNSVCMGLTLMTEEMAGTLKENSKTHVPNFKGWLALAEEVTANANSAVDVLNDFLNYDKVESGKLALEHSVVTIFDLIEQTAAEFRVPAAKKQIRLVVKTPISDLESGAKDMSQERFLVGDKVRLTMVVRNLISNSIKFTPLEGTVTVDASWMPPTKKERRKGPTQMNFTLQHGENVTVGQDGSLLLTVTDTGVGMTQEQIKSVFRQGSQFNAGELQAGNGSGLGTWIAKGIIRQHGGLLSAFSEGMDHGSTFAVNLPIHDIPSDLLPVSFSNSITATSYSTDGEDDEDDIGCLHILVVDDAKMNLKLLTRLLVKHGHIVDCADDGDVAVTKVEAAMMSGNKQFDVILMDYQMPRMTGPEAAQKIREMGAHAFIVGVTGNMMPEDVQFFKDAGANAVLPKPIKIPDLENLFIEYGIRGDEIEDHSQPPMDLEMSAEMEASLRYEGRA